MTLVDWLLQRISPGPPPSEIDRRLDEREQRSREARQQAEAAIREAEFRRRRVQADTAAMRAFSERHQGD